MASRGGKVKVTPRKHGYANKDCLNGNFNRANLSGGFQK